jgi:hypothetical protein
VDVKLKYVTAIKYALVDGNKVFGELRRDATEEASCIGSDKRDGTTEGCEVLQGLRKKDIK